MKNAHAIEVDAVRPLSRSGARIGRAREPESLVVLLVEDNPGDAELVTAVLGDEVLGGARFTIERAVRLSDAQRVLARRPVDVVLLDLSLPDGDGLTSLDVVRAAAPEVPVVVMTGLADDEVALRAVQAGAQDYLVKGRDGDGAVRRAVLYAVERQRLIRAARQATEARDEMLAIVSHDLRNPIGTIGMCAQALLDPEPVPPDSAREMGMIIERSCEWMLRLIGDLLDVTRMEAGMLPVNATVQPVDGIVEQLREQFAPQASARGVTFRIVQAPSLPPVLADGDRVVQALGNLIGNAIKFTPAGGDIVLTITCGVGVDGARLCFELTDSGKGIPPESLVHIFDRFWQMRNSRRGGAGLGLAIARGIIEAHTGTIQVSSTPDVGTTFVCTFPAAIL